MCICCICVNIARVSFNTTFCVQTITCHRHRHRRHVNRMSSSALAAIYRIPDVAFFSATVQLQPYRMYYVRVAEYWLHRLFILLLAILCMSWTRPFATSWPQANSHDVHV